MKYEKWPSTHVRFSNIPDNKLWIHLAWPYECGVTGVGWNQSKKVDEPKVITAESAVELNSIL